MTGLSRREMLAAVGAAPLSVHAARFGQRTTLIADRAILPPGWAGTALVLEAGAYISEGLLEGLPAGPTLAALRPANAFLLGELLRIRRRPLEWRAGLQHFTW